MEQIISLGSNCSITYQLNKYNLRLQSFPFDWSKITIKQLNKVLEMNFHDYENIFIKKFSENHNSSYIVSNKYNIIFAHEIFDKYNIEEFKKVLIKRINNFINNKSFIKFIRIELQPITKSYLDELNKLIKLLDNYFHNYKIILLIDTDSNLLIDTDSKLIIKKIINFNNYIDWKMDYINWYDIFYNI
jgi:hypothetical protein